jgi:hypothetical protein
MGKYDDRPYEVGKGKPPKQSQWRKGQSGNPRGPRVQPKEADQGMREMLADLANQLVPVKKADGEVIMLPKKKAILLGLVHDALSGTPRQRRDAVALLREERFFELKPSDRPETAKEREEAIDEFIRTLAKEAEKEGHVIDYPELRSQK